MMKIVSSKKCAEASLTCARKIKYYLRTTKAAKNLIINKSTITILKKYSNFFVTRFVSFLAVLRSSFMTIDWKIFSYLIHWIRINTCITIQFINILKEIIWKMQIFKQFVWNTFKALNGRTLLRASGERTKEIFISKYKQNGCWLVCTLMCISN